MRLGCIHPFLLLPPQSNQDTLYLCHLIVDTIKFSLIYYHPYQSTYLVWVSYIHQVRMKTNKILVISYIHMSMHRGNLHVRQMCLIWFLNQTPIFERYVVRCVSKNEYQKDIHLKDIGLCAQNMISIPSSIVDIIGRGVYDHLINTRIFTLIVRYSHELQRL